MEQSRGPNDRLLVDPLCVLASIRYSQGRDDEAAALALRAVDIESAVFGRESSNLADALLVLGKVHLRARRPEEARNEFARAYRMWESSLGPAHPFVAEVLIELGRAESANGQPEQALRRFRRAVRILRTYAIVQKYAERCPAWVALAADAASSRMVDLCMYLSFPWEEDAEIERLADQFIQTRARKDAASYIVAACWWRMPAGRLRLVGRLRVARFPTS